MLPARHRLTDGADFAAAVRGARAGSALIVVHAIAGAPRRDLPPRAGVVVSRAVGNAVVRNRTKRRIRGLLGGRMGELPPGLDLVVRATPAAATAGSAQLGAELDRLLPWVLRSRRARPAAGREERA